ncbi:hypothetical protein [Planctomicrobium piriforme]|uniref:NADH:quinone oxidoreductase/Mrp antiporter membrane subunit domain-containing protein n=1 Tax=Planctomicrobium piriforme TaxID=1576369 RepID=A0A1I3B779_9PLAN|nr:hypothetical protein [Planctomicrobium piriforme]SFH58134.1 hypothetical protein SAMN05421753_101279 [Planctomicrobium piriforme]
MGFAPESGLLILLLAPAAAGLLLLFRSFAGLTNFSRSQFWAFFLAGTVTAGVVLGADFALHQNDPDRTSGPIAFLRSLPLLTPDWVAICGIGISSLSGLLILSWPRPRALPAAAIREAWAGLWLAVAVTVTLLADGIWLQWASVVASSWLLSLILAQDDTDGDAAQGAGQCLVWLTVADFIWLCGLLTFGLVWVSPGVSNLTDQSQLQNLNLEQSALAVTGQTFLLISMILRCGLYPLMSWTRSAAISYRVAAWVTAFGLGQGLLLSLRWSPMLTFFAETQLLMAGLGGLSAVLLGLIAVSGAVGPRRLLSVASAQIGLVWLGLAATPNSTNIPAAVPGLAAVLLIVGLSLGLDEKQRGPSIVWCQRVLWAFALLLCCGLLGQEQLGEAVRKSEALHGLNPRVLLGTVLAGQLLTTIALFRELADPASAATLRSRPDLSTLGWIFFAALLLCGVAGLVASPLLWFGTGRIAFSLPIASSIVMLIGILAARNWSDRPANVPGEQLEQQSLLRRMTGVDFYIPTLIQLFILAPIRIVAQLSRFFDWFFLGQLVQKVPATLVQRIADSSTHADEETPESGTTWQLLAAAACLVAGILLAGV